MENKLLIGITGTPHSHKRHTARRIREELELRHYNIRQPVVLACAAITGIGQEQFDRLSCEQPLPLLKTTVGELQNRIAQALRLTNNSYLVAQLCNRIGADSNTDYLFNGAIVSGITTEDEADWLRERGGILVHLRDARNIREPHRLVQLHNNDILCTFDGHKGPSEPALQGLISTLKDRMMLRENAA